MKTPTVQTIRPLAVGAVLLLLSLTALPAVAQVTMTIGAVSAKPGDTVSVPITVTNFTSVGAISLKITYVGSALQYLGITGAPVGVVFTSNAANNVITLGWFDATATSPITIGTGTLVTIRGIYLGGNSPLTFNTSSCDIANASGTSLSVTYGNGGVTTPPLAVTLGSVQVPVNTTAVIPITVTNFTSVGAVSMKIQYDTTVLQFDSLANVAASMSFTKGTSGGVLSLGWFDATGNSPVTIASGKLMDLKFTYKGGTSAVSVLSAQSEIANGTGTTLNVQYTNGQVSLGVASKPTMNTIAAVTKKEQDTVKIVVSATDPNMSDILTYSATNLPTGATFTPATQTFMWVPALNTAGIYTVKFFVTNGSVKDSTNAVITITKNNLKPVFVSRVPAQRDSVQVNYSNSVLFTVHASDPNRDTLTYTWKLNGTTVKTGTDSTYDAKGKFVSTGPQTLVCVFADGGGLRDSTTWAFNVVSTSTGVTELPSGVPTEFTLSQNYPNPFNPSTTIDFGLPKASTVSLVVYNIAGEKVRTLISGTMMSAAYHRIAWDGRNDAGITMPSGMYLCRLVTPERTMAMKMLLMK